MVIHSCCLIIKNHNDQPVLDKLKSQEGESLLTLTLIDVLWVISLISLICILIQNFFEAEFRDFLAININKLKTVALLLGLGAITVAIYIVIQSYNA